MLDRLLELDDQPLFLENLGWAWYAGVEPERLLAGAAPRVPLVHVKDLATGTGLRHVPVGEGDVDYGRILPDPRARRRMAAGRAGRDARRRAGGGPPLLRRGHRDGRGAHMRSPARVGIVGCGVISRAYIVNAAAFDTFEIVACADLDASRARRQQRSSRSSR